ncbi:MAG: hypothetical protein BGO55_14845 [Sphingobacteriales bacterium 50-39]|mgnify:CR=1 FL=1|nr:hypothetical protein [Sphingobacteriales bacterium]OJW57557.1 MAG: hypothetical protein BGO55_14845 [Sphingobacteriales bacterium 50-39]
MEGYDKHVRNARITLYEVAGLFLLGLFLIKDMEDVAGKIMTAILIGLIIFVSLQIFNAIADPSTR